MAKIKILPKDNYLAAIKNSSGCNIFKDVYGEVAGKKINLTKGGDLSCALFVTSILKLFNIITDIHLTVDSAVNDLLKNNAKEIPISHLKAGDIIVYVEQKKHKHIGFYMGNFKAVSNSAKLKKINIHHFTFNGQRPIEKIINIKI